MNVARILYPVKVLGPGLRVGIWMCGCNRACKGCSNPELWEPKAEYETTTDNILELMHGVRKNNRIDGFTITGGEPMNQASELAYLIDGLRMISEDILVYSGYQYEELDRQDAAINHILSHISVLVDGEYVEEKNDGSVLRGSSNQRIHILDSRFRKTYESYMERCTNKIQNFTTTDGIVSVGIHRRGFTG